MNDQMIQENNDLMRSGSMEQSEEDLERELQWLIKSHSELESKFENHDCTATQDDGCEVCQNYYSFCNKYLYE